VSEYFVTCLSFWLKLAVLPNKWREFYRSKSLADSLSASYL